MANKLRLWLERNELADYAELFLSAGYCLEDMEALSLSDARLVAAEEICMARSDDVESFVNAIAARDFSGFPQEEEEEEQKEEEKTLSLPEDIVILIVRLAPLRSFVSLMALDKAWYSRCARQRPWRRLVCRGRAEQDEQRVRGISSSSVVSIDDDDDRETLSSSQPTTHKKKNRLGEFLRSVSPGPSDFFFPSASSSEQASPPAPASRLSAFVESSEQDRRRRQEEEEERRAKKAAALMFAAQEEAERRREKLLATSRLPASSFFVADRCGAGVAAMLQSNLTWTEKRALASASKAVLELLAEAPLRLQLHRTILLDDPPKIGTGGVAYLSLRSVRGRKDPARPCDIAARLISVNASRLVSLDVSHFCHRTDGAGDLSFLRVTLGDVHFPNLSVLSLQAAPVTHVDALVSRCPRLAQLRLAGLPDLGDDDLVDVLSAAPKTLTTVILSDLDFGDRLVSTALNTTSKPFVFNKATQNNNPQQHERHGGSTTHSPELSETTETPLLARLTALHLAPSNRPLTDLGLRSLVGARRLRHLALLRGAILDSTDSLAAILALPSLERLALGSITCGQLGIDDILAASFGGTEPAGRLQPRGSTPALRNLRFLKLILVSGSALGPRALQAIAAKTPSLERFELCCDPSKYELNQFLAFHLFRALKTIVLRSVKLSDREISDLRSMLAPIDFQTGSWSRSNHLPDLFHHD